MSEGLGRVANLITAITNVFTARDTIAGQATTIAGQAQQVSDDAQAAAGSATLARQHANRAKQEADRVAQKYSSTEALRQTLGTVGQLVDSGGGGDFIISGFTGPWNGDDIFFDDTAPAASITFDLTSGTDANNRLKNVSHVAVRLKIIAELQAKGLGALEVAVTFYAEFLNSLNEQLGEAGSIQVGPFTTEVFANTRQQVIAGVIDTAAVPLNAKYLRIHVICAFGQGGADPGDCNGELWIAGAPYILN